MKKHKTKIDFLDRTESDAQVIVTTPRGVQTNHFSNITLEL